MVDEWVTVVTAIHSDNAASLAKEGILVGGSGGTTMWSGRRWQKRLDE